MISFNKYLVEAKNTHMEHLEDNVLNGGVDGARQSINFLQSLRDMLAGHSNVKLNTTVKTIAALCILARPNFLIEDKVGNPLILFKFLEYLGTVNPILGVVCQVNSKTRVVVRIRTLFLMSHRGQ